MTDKSSNSRREGREQRRGSRRDTRAAARKQEYLCGFHAIQAALDKQPGKVKQLFVQQGRSDQRIDTLIQAARQSGVSVQAARRETLDELAEGVSHQGVLALFTGGSLWDENDLQDILDQHSEQALLLVLDGITDPHNLGACLRAANGAGVHAVIAPRDKSASLTPVVRKVACGAADQTPFIQVTNLSRTLRALQTRGIWVVGLADAEDSTVFTAKLNGPLALVVGAEGHGLRRLTREHCDQIVAIPMLGGVSSLNVSVATGVCLYEALRQRQG